jgi:polysaccharide deacetylase 2 family uncharacterized protein YibQ
MTEKNDREILVRSQDGRVYRKFDFPLEVMSPEDWNVNIADEREKRSGFVLVMGYTTPIAEYTEEKHAIHVMNYLLAKRNHYMFDDVGSVKSIILNVPTDEAVKLTPEENLIDGIPVKENNEVTKNESISE